MFFFLVFGMLALVYGYTGWRLFAPLRLSPTGNLAVWTGWIVLSLLPALALRMRGHAAPSWAQTALSWLAYLGLGFAVLTFSLLVVRDLAWLAAGAADRLFSPVRVPDASDPARRRFLLNTLNLCTVGISASLTGYGLYAARRRIRLFEISVPIEGLPPALDGFRILQLSDLHAGLTIGRGFVQRIADQAGKLTPDLIALTGDLADGEVPDLREQVAPLAGLNAPHGCFFVTGNHEYYNSDPEAWIEEIRRLGFTVLLNEHRIVERGGCRILLAGVTDYDAGRILPSHTSDPEAALSCSTDCDLRILLAHQPRTLYAAARIGCDLLLSGHTHGGQFVPWKWTIPLQQPFVSGLHLSGKTWIYVNRGAGYWGPPLRLGVPAEITLLTLRHTEEPIA